MSMVVEKKISTVCTFYPLHLNGRPVYGKLKRAQIQGDLIGRIFACILGDCFLWAVFLSNIEVALILDTFPAIIIRLNCNLSADNSPANKSPTDKSPTDKSPTDKLPTDKLPTDKSPTDKLPNTNSPPEISPHQQLAPLVRLG
jgi:hypothetical protein